MTFDTFLVQRDGTPKKGRGVAFTVSLLVHGALLIGALVFSAWHIDELTPPALAVTFSSLAAPPPPPPLAQGGPRQRTRVRARTPSRAVVEPTPTATAPQEKTAEEPKAADNGVLPGTEHGEKSSGTDRVIDGGGDDPGRGRERGTGTGVFVPPNVARGQLAIDPQSDQYRPKLPPAVIHSGMVIWVLARLCARSDGQVEQVKIIKGADPTVDPLIAAALQTWRYRPWAVDGRPVPFCTNVRYEVITR
jgi:hypothetical protein